MCCHYHNCVGSSTVLKKVGDMEIRVVVPLATAMFNGEVAHEFTASAEASTQISVVNLSEGPQSIESECEEALAVPDFLRKAKDAERDGCTAVICDCFGDPGVRPAREAVDIPVVGPGEAAMLLAACLGQRFSVVTVLRSVFPLIEAVAWHAGVDRKLASIRSVDIPVLDLTEKSRLVTKLYEEMVRAVEEDDAHVLILGCTGMMGVARELETRLEAGGLDVPVVDPVAASLRLAETLAALKLRQSRRTYHRPKISETTRSAA
jgi:allantoin racemase